jgi:hypothetical protein
MRVHNVHERTVALPAEEAGALLDSLAGPDDRVWPAFRWPALRLDPGLQVGARGGHGPIRYEVVAYDPGRSVRFRFRGMPGIDGEHAFEVRPAGEGRSVVSHVFDAELVGRARLEWIVALRRLHDACVEDALDRAEGAPPRPLRWPVRVARALGRRRMKRRPPTPSVRGSAARA